eukprot:jgi/Picsp_1/4010/NSC_01522-R1_leucine-rich repeat family protein
MGNCLGKGNKNGSKEKGGVKLDPRRRSFSKRVDPWEKTGMEFPKEVQGIANKVRVLDGSGNKISEVPFYIENMIRCHRLGLSKNRIREIPEGIGSMVNLRVLLLDHNRLVDLPPALFTLTKLERLSLAHNHLTELPKNVSHLDQLKYIDISGNKIRSITRGIAGCSNLEELRCSDNVISKLPIDLAKLEKLRLLVAENNRISTVPSEIFTYCESLQTMALHGNPITEQDLEEIKGYQDFDARRQRKWDKAISAGVLLGQKHFEEVASRTPTSSG